MATKKTDSETEPYVPINASAAEMVNKEAFDKEVEKTQEWLNKNPSAGTDHTDKEYRKQFGDIYDNAEHTTPADREVPKGESGADAGNMSSGDYAVVQSLKQTWADENAVYEKYKDSTDPAEQAMAQEALAKRNAAHLSAEKIRSAYGYYGGEDGSMYMYASLFDRQNGDDKNNGGGGGTGSAQATPNMPDTDADALVNQWKSDIPDVDKAKADQLALLEEWKNTLIEKNNGQIDYNVAKAITELERALADAQPQFKEQQESVYRDEMQSRDNSALYAEARGDKGGIGQEQYDSIMNTAAQNRLSVQQAQTKLATDTQRQIADLRAQGEFEKADAMLEISQQYLSQLINLEQWALDYGLTTAQFKASLDQWAANYKLAIAEFEVSVDQWNKNFAYQQYRDQESDRQWWAQFNHSTEQDRIANEQWDQQFKHATEQDQIANDQWWAQFNKSSSKGSVEDVGDIYDQMSAAGITSDRAYAYLIAQGYSDTEASKMERTYGNLLKTMNNTPTSEAYDSVETGAQNLHKNKYSDASIADYLQSRVDSGVITQAEADMIANRILEEG